MNKNGYDARAKKFASAFQDATGLKTEVAFSSTDGKTVLLMSTNGSPEKTTKLIDDVLVPFRNSEGIGRGEIGFAEGDGKSIHSIIANPKAANNQIIISLPGEERGSVDDKILKALSNNKDKLREGTSKTLTGVSVSDLALPIKLAFQEREHSFSDGAPISPEVATSKVPSRFA